ncbi:MAG: PfkB family carbohydrate kinase [Candidatus Krumholzibacteria bacterium]|nr:PfkB family carbohydrate kinase [Candidatus Krumholzibacteria bacterium]
MQKRFDVVGIGYTALDYLGIVPHLPVENTKLEVRDFTIQGGGPTATAMVTMRRLGLSAAYAGKVGDDPFGERMLEELRREDVDASAVIVEPGATSQYAFIMVDAATAARTILWTRGSVSPLKAHEVNLDLVRSARGLFIDDLEPEAALVAAKAARKAEIPVLIDAGSLREGVRELLPLCDYIIASELFAEQISGSKNLRAALETLGAFGPKASVVTLGEKGCAYLSGAEVVDVPGFAVKAVDTTGAGDVFHGAYLFAVLEGLDTMRACVFANAVAALKCRRLGGRAGIPSLSEALAFLSRERPGMHFHLKS